MHGYRSGSTHGLEPTVDWRALFVLSTCVSAAICVAIFLVF
jgi:hypothetical protein